MVQWLNNFFSFHEERGLHLASAFCLLSLFLRALTILSPGTLRAVLNPAPQPHPQLATVLIFMSPLTQARKDLCPFRSQQSPINQVSSALFVSGQCSRTIPPTRLSIYFQGLLNLDENLLSRDTKAQGRKKLKDKHLSQCFLYSIVKVELCT